jgi:FKBP-type peptidyl-prolyl cis-trans isomerase FklB
LFSSFKKLKMKRTILVVAGTLCIVNVFAQAKKPVIATKPATANNSKAAVGVSQLKNGKDSASYALGVRIAQNLKGQGFETLNMSLLQKAMGDVLQSKKTLLEETLLDECISRFHQKVAAEKASVAKKEGLAFLAANGKRKGVVTMPNGLQYEVIKTGTDTVKPGLTDKVKCHYHGTLINGTVFDSSVDRGEPVSFPLNGVIKGWQEALQLMTVGSKWKLYIPSELAYGDRAAGDKIAPGSTLIFEVELLAVEK